MQDPVCRSGAGRSGAGRTGALHRARRRGPGPDDRESLSYRAAGVIGAFETLALLPGISRSGISTVGGFLQGQNHEDAARFPFQLATPVILAAGLLKIPTLFGPAGNGIHVR